MTERYEELSASITELKKFATGENTGTVVHKRYSNDNSMIRKYETETEKVYSNGKVTFKFEKHRK